MATPRKKGAKKTKARPAAAPTNKAQPEQSLGDEVLQRELTEAREQQAATGEILRMIARSPGDLQKVMDAIAEKAARLCDADDALVRRLEGDRYYSVSHFGSIPTATALGADSLLDRSTPAGRAVVDRKTIHVPDLRAAAKEFPGARIRGLTVGVRTALAAPLLRDGQAIGSIHIRRTKVRPFTDTQIKLLETFADQAVIAIENARLFNDRESRNRDLAALQDVTAAASQSLDIKPVLDEVVKKITEIFHFDGVRIFIYDPRAETLNLMALHGLPDVVSSRAFQRGQGNAGWVAETGQCLIFEDTRTDPRYAQLSQTRLNQRSGSHFLALFPIKSKEKFLGTVNCVGIEPRKLLPEEIRLIESMCDQIGVAVENINLFDEVRNKTKQLESSNAELREALEQQTATSEILSVIASSPNDLQPVFQTILDNAVRLCEAHTGAMFRFDGEMFRVVVANNVSPALRAYIESTPIPPGRESALRRVGLEKRPIHIPDMLADPECKVPESYKEEGMRTNLAVPLLKENNLIGAIAIHRTEVRPFTDQQIRLLETFASQAVIAIENVRLFQELKEALEQQTATSEILGVIASSPTDIQPVLNAVTENAARLCDANDAQIRLVNGDILEQVASYGTMPATESRPISRGFVGGRAIIEKRTVHVHDLDAERETEYPETPIHGNRTALAVPLLREGEPIGVVNIRRQEVRPFTEKQIKLLETFAAQSVIAIENVRLFKELQKRNRDLTEALEQQTATGEVLRVIASSPTDLQPVLDTVAESAARLCDSQDAQIYRVDGDMMCKVARYGTVADGIPLGSTRRISRGSNSGRAIVDRQPVHIHDMLAEREEEFPDVWHAAHQERLRTVLAVPLMREDIPIGAILLRRIELRPFAEKQISLLKTFADQAVIAIENVRLFNELKESLEQQTATSEILGVIANSPTDIQPVLEIVAATSARLCEATDAQIRLVEGEGTRLVASFGSRPAPEYVASSRRTAAASSLEERRTIHIQDLRAELDRFPDSRELVELTGTRTILSVPMLREGAPIGQINIRRTEVRPFSDKQIKLLETFASQAVIAIENVRLFQELKESLEQQTATSEILGVIASSPTDINPVLDAVAANAARVCGADDAVIRLVEGDALIMRAHYGPFEPEAAPRPIDRRSVVGRAVVDRQLIHIDDIMPLTATEFPEAQLSTERGGIRTVLAAPLQREGIPIGVIFIRRTVVKPFTDKQIALLKTFADQAVIAIENVRLFKELQERNAELREALEHQTATAEVLSIISRSPTDVQPVLDAIVESAARVCGIDDVVLRLREADMIAVRAHFGSIPPGRPHISVDESQYRWIREHGALHIPDLQAQNEFPGLGTVGNRTYLAVPLLQQRELIGVLAARRMDVHPFTPAQIKLLQTFADQAVIAIENVRLFNELKESLEQQTATSEILGVIASSPTNIQPVLNVVAQNAAKLCEAKDAVITRVDGKIIKQVAQYGAMPVPEPNEINRYSPVGRAIVDRKTTHVHDLAAEIETEFPESKERQQQSGTRTMLVTPLLREGIPVGTINIRRTEVRPFSEKQIKLLETFADQAVIAIENVRLFNELDSRNRQLTEALEQQTATSEILRVIASSPTDIQPVLDVVAENAARLCDANDALIYRQVDDCVNLVAQFGSIPVLGKPLPISRGFVGGRAMIDRRTIHVHDVSEEIDTEYPIAKPLQQLARSRTVLGTPLLRQSEPIGSIVIRRTEVRPFTEKQIKLLETFADQAVIAIENVRLFQELQERTRELVESVEEMKALSEVGQTVSSTLDLETVLETIVARAVDLSGTDCGVIYEYDEAAQEFNLRASHRMEAEAVEALRTARIRLGEGATGQAASTRAPVQILDTFEPQDRAVSRVRPVLNRLGYRSLLTVPILREKQIMGGLTVWRRQVGEFEPEVVKLLQTFATQSALAIHNARLFREIQAKGRELEAANRHKSEFLANVSHELRTPLNAIIGFSEVLLEKLFGELNDKQNEYVDDILSSGRHLLSLINDILDLSKIEAGRMELEMTTFHLPDAIENALLLVRERASRHGIKLERIIDDRLGDFTGDERKVKQILVNLLSNAVKFTPEGGQVKVEARLGESAAIVSVADTGIGIAKEDQEAIFEEFRQVGSNYAQKREGTGLGLALTKRFVELHGGRIWVESGVGNGSTFTFTLPLG